MRDAISFDGDADGLPDRAAPALAVVDAQGVVVGWSPSAERVFGYPPQAAIGHPVDRLLGADAGTDNGATVRAALDGRNATALLRHRDGRRLEVRLRAYPWVDGEGRARRLVVATPPGGPEADEPPSAAPAPEEAAAFAQCRLPVMVFDSSLRAVRASAGAQHELGRSEERMAGVRVADLLPDDHACQQVEDSMRRVLATGETEQFRVRGRARPALREGVWSMTVSPLKGPDGRTRQVEVSALDVTEQHLARERLTLLNDASTRIGTTLDVMRTAQEMADLVVGHLADFVTVDLLDSLFRGIEPRPSPSGAVTLRRAAQQSVLPGVPEALYRPGDVDDYPPSTPPARCLATGEASLHRTVDPAIRAWQRVDEARSGVLRTFGVHSVMVIPLRARAITLGVALLVRHRREEPFTEDDLVLAEEIGARAAVAVDNARRYTLERETALALQRSLLPRRTAAQEGVEVAHRYLPARTRAGLGGDWYDVIPLSGARVALVVGDVVGHGLRASATMGRLRTAVRTLADVDLPPDELLTHLDDLVTHVVSEEETPAPRGPDLEVPTDLVATCLYVVHDPVSGRCTAASAGHPPPAVVTPVGTVDFVDIRPGPPLGLGGLPFETREWDMPPGGLLVLYTDGLVQGTRHDLGSGLARLRHCLERPAASLEAIGDDLFRTLLPAQPQDDAALLLARTRTFDADHVATWDLPSDPAAVADARADVAARLAAWDLEDVAFTAELVVSELVTNAIRYGQPPLQLRLILGSALTCEVYDSSDTAPHLRRARKFDEGGRGLLLVAQFSRRWGTRHRARGKTIWAEIELPARGT